MRSPLYLLIPVALCVLVLSDGALSQIVQKKAKNTRQTEIIVSQFPDDSNDSAQKFYRQGYHLILNEQWAEARERLTSVVAGFPKSKYKEVAQYWIAYTLKEDGQPGAAQAYRTFIDRYPQSNYYDDAIADLDELLPEPPELVNVVVPIIRMDGMGNVTADSLHVTYKHKNKGFSYYVNVVPRVQSLEKLFRLEVHQKRRSAPVRLREVIPPDMQKQLEVEISAAEGLDGETFHHLQGVVFDQTKPEELREAAVFSLSISDTFDTLPLFADLVKRDTNKGLQFYAIENLRHYTKDRNRAVTTMIKLFNELPPERSEVREMIFYSIADVGNDKAVDFLIDIVESKAESVLVDQAIYYLGSLGSEKARTALRKVYKVK